MPYHLVCNKFLSKLGLKTFRYLIIEGAFDTAVMSANAYLPMLKKNDLILFIFASKNLKSMQFMSNFLMFRFLQHCHIPDAYVGRMTGFWSFATAIGVMLGGRVSGRMHVLNKDRGRILTAQFSMGISIPLFVIMFIFIPRQAHFWWAFLMIKTLKAFFG